jgi:ABC-type polysaccharide/polyol phosphate transport system ATPase subunit
MLTLKISNLNKKFFLHYDQAAYPNAEIEALKNINLEIESGQVIGIIGRNGSGKTTLLNIIAGIMTPTAGKVEVHGRISSMLALGAGFQLELSGRENILLNASLLGMNDDEIKKKFYDMVKFSELGTFIDKPLQSYSQGMKMRLGFSVAAHVDFDILLVDEILSVGDIDFQNKSYEKIEEFRRKDKTMIVVSQSLEMIERLCDKVILLEKGEIITEGKPQEGIKKYKDLLAEKCFSEIYAQDQKEMIEEGLRWWAIKEEWGKRVGPKEIEVTEVKLLNSKDRATDNFKPGDNLIVKANFIVHNKVYDPHFGVAIFKEDGTYCYGPNTRFDGYRFDEVEKGKGWLSIKYKDLNLMPGAYRISLGVWDRKEKYPYDYLPGFYKFNISGPYPDKWIFKLNHKWKSQNGIRAILGKITPFSSESKEELKHMTDFDFTKGWGRSFGKEEVEIKKTAILDKDGLFRDTFGHGELMQVRAELDFKKSLDDYFIWVGLFRNDKVYCHGAVKKLNKERTCVSLIYPNIELLNGRYHVSVGILNNNGEVVHCHHAIDHFDVYFHKKDHGTVFIDHEWRWKFNGQA